MNLVKIAVDERIKQLTRKMNGETNTMIKEIIAKEIELLKKEFDSIKK